MESRQVAPASVGGALARLRGATSFAELMRGATTELCTSCGFDRAVLFRVDGALLMVESAYFTGDAEGARQFVELGRVVPPQLNHLLLETAMLRQGGPVLVSDALGDPRTFKPLVQACGTKSYVAAPVSVGGQVVVMLHADQLRRGRPVNELDRDVLWGFAQGFAPLLERLLLRVPAMHGSVVSRHPLDGLLAPREVQVLELMATGASNAEIARQLAISVGTVKSHVKHILRKLHAANRAEAVSRYLRLSASTGEGTEVLPV